MDDIKKEVISLKEIVDQKDKEIDELKSKLTDLDEIISLLPGNVYWKDTNGVCLGCNENFAKILKLRRDQVIGKSGHDFLDKENADYILNIDREIMAQNKEVVVEEKGYDSEGNEAIYFTRKVPLHDKNGVVTGLLGISIDISERKKLEDSLKIAKEKAEEADRLKGEFIRNMEHDIRTPFSGIYGMAEYLLHEEKDPVKKDFLSDIKNSAKELLDLCNSILEFSKVESKNLLLQSKKFDLLKVAKGVVYMELPSAKSKQLEFSFRYPDNLPKVIIGDEHRLQRILLNLISNAVKFTEKGKISVSLQLIKNKNQRVVIQFVITDTGIGIAQEKKELIYEKFSRINQSNKGKYKGLGLGLCTVKQFVSEMKGEIDVISEIGSGTTFICTLPFKLPLVSEIV